LRGAKVLGFISIVAENLSGLEVAVIYTMKQRAQIPFRTSNLLLFFGAFILAGLALGGVLSLALGAGVYGLGLEEINQVVAAPNAGNASLLMWMNTVSQLSTFLLPALMFMLIFGMPEFPIRTARLTGLILLSAVLMICAIPVIDWLAQLNRLMIPSGSWMEQMALPAESRALELTRTFLSLDCTGCSALLFLHIALIPAVCEEVTFRGVLQPLLVKGTGNKHVGIWLAAFAFSSIHLQFYGFIPRLFLGAGLGYLAWGAGSIWPAVMAHFINNALGVMLFKWSGGNLEMTFPLWLQFVMIAGLAGGIFIYRRLIKQPKIHLRV